ncbi:hypothetical protein BDV27DRAFT_172559 [Aspergillus caelatus]|uniref:Uncharacterized protein n=1 Tax=Aspergillus caelatus TaxID=61420 RepID=A0A5N7A2I2_9EURO|nr:uncharacterized protein BDV27DRAFT_172559 [Aspergillus caelatus]KAE8364087.1 hypothetical protein BDV27DRAFT_172559 [Aspergillus caelatus]
MKESLQAFIFSMLLLGCNIAPAHARIPASAFRSGRLRSYNNTPIYNPGMHHSPSTDVVGNLGNHGPSVHDIPKVSTLSSDAAKSGCPSLTGNITVNAYQLYPEHADFNEDDCLVYLSTVAVYDPYKKEIVDSIHLPGLSGDPILHMSGVVVDPQGLLSVIVDAGAAFDTQGQDISGDNFLVKVDPGHGQVLWRKNLTEVTNGVYGGYQDAAHDTHGNTFVVGTFPTSIVKVGPNGSTAIPWYLQPQPNQTVAGLSGLAASGDILLSTDSSDGQLYRFNMTEKVGHKIHVPLKGSNATRIGNSLDGILLPKQFNGTVLLVSDTTDGTVVLRSADGLWTSAEMVGTVPNLYVSQNGFSVDNVEIGGSLYSVTEFFLDEKVPGTLAGNRTQFPLVDITHQVLRLLK